jgi:hypothetical protein
MFDSFWLPFVLFMVFAFIYVYYTFVQRDFHIGWCSCHLTVLRRLSRCGAGTANPSGAHEFTLLRFSFLHLFLCSFFADRNTTEPTSICITFRPHSLNPMYSYPQMADPGKCFKNWARNPLESHPPPLNISF